MATSRFAADDLRAFAARVFLGLGLPDADAALVADGLVEADLRGLHSHGVARIPIYAKRLRAGIVNPSPAIRVDEATPVVAAVDGDDGMGFVVGDRAMRKAIEIAGRFGIGLAGIRRSTHFGMAAIYVKQASAAGYLSLVFTNSSPALPVWGGRTTFLGAAPFAAGAPGGEGPGFLLDMAMTVTARGKIRLAAQRGEPIAEGLALDAEGRPTTDARKAFEGVCLPFGGPKGAGLSMLMDVLCGVLTGANFGGDVRSLYFDFAAPQNVGHFFLAIRPDLFMPRAEYDTRIDTFTDRVKAQPRAVGFDEILVPGEPEERKKQAFLAAGIPLTDDIVAAVLEASAGIDAAFPTALVRE